MNIEAAKSILIISHVNPDGDTLGSMCGLAALIESNFKKRCDTMAVSKIPSVYEFLPGVEKVKQVGEFDKSREYDLVITVDVASLERIGDGKIFFEKAKNTVSFDHHKTTENFAGTNIIDADKSSACEVILDFAKEQGWKINADAALCFYTGILTDTGSFRFNNTKPATLRWAADLVEKGVDPSDTYRKIYENDLKSTALLQAYCVGKAVFEDDDKIAYIIVYKKDLEKFGASDESLEGLTERLRAIKSVQTAFVAKETGFGSKVSMRTKVADAAKICEYFGGGGHKFAAGCTMKTAPDMAARKILEVIYAG